MMTKRKRDDDASIDRAPVPEAIRPTVDDVARAMGSGVGRLPAASSSAAPVKKDERGRTDGAARRRRTVSHCQRPRCGQPIPRDRQASGKVHCSTTCETLMFGHVERVEDEFALRLARLRAIGADNGKGACRWCGVMLEADTAGTPLHPAGACDGPPSESATPSVMPVTRAPSVPDLQLPKRAGGRDWTDYLDRDRE